MKARDCGPIVAAAVRSNGAIWAGLRHGVIMQWIWAELGPVKILAEDQGFLTASGLFLNRWQAGGVAHITGQTKKRRQHLLSEDLW